MEKCKALWSKLLSNKKLLWGVIGGIAAVLVAVAVIIAVSLGGNKSMIGCTVTVKTEGGMALEGIGIYVYTDTTKSELVTFIKTDKDGKAAIAQEVPVGSVAMLEGVPAGYAVAESYSITTEDTQIVLTVELLKEMAPISLGSVMFDFTVTDTDGTSHTLSQLLKEKDAVVLNLWYTNCGPCKTEFPFLQDAFSSYSEKIALLALNPVAEDDAEAVKAFKADNALTFPMAKVDAQWANQVPGIAYPTTIVIDRFGTVALIHVGGIDDAKTFTDAFAYFTDENYVQTKVANIKDLETEIAPTGQGTAENPLEFGGVTEFEVTVKPGEKVYCDVYKVSGMIMKLQDPAATVTYNNTEFTSKNGAIEMEVTAEDTFSPVKLAIGNTAADEKTFKVTFSFLPGTLGNPIVLEIGSLDVKIPAGNEQGVYYLYKATEAGKLTLSCTASPQDVKYGFTLYNLMTYKMLTYEENGFLAAGTNDPALEIEVNPGDEVQFVVSTLPNEENVYPAADLTFTAAFEKGEVSSGNGNTGGDSTGGNTGGGSTGGGSTGGGSTGGGSTGGGSTGGGSTGGGSAGGGSSTGKSTELYVGTAYYVVEGSNAVSLNSGDITYLVFEPTRSGQYQFSVDGGALTYYGNNTSFIQDLTNTTNCNGTSLDLNIKEGHLGSTFIFGINKSSGAATMTVTRTGNAQLDINDMPWNTYTGTQTPSKFTYTGGKLTAVDITGPTVNLVYGSDGYYHWGSANGPVVYVDLDDETYLSFAAWLSSDYPVVRAVIGNQKWDFSNLMSSYNKNKDKTQGVYPMTEDLKFMLESLYAHSKWGEHLLGDVTGLNDEMGWLFCCYFEG